MSVVLPTLNEAKNLPLLIPRIDRFLKKYKYRAEIIIVDDKGDDNTSDVARKLSKKYGYIKVIERPVREGAGVALWQGIELAKGEIIITMEADNSCDPEDMKKIINKLKSGYDVVVASRYMKGGSNMKGFFSSLLSKYGNLYVSILHGIPIHDFSFAYRGFYKRIVKTVVPIEWDGNAFLMEFVVKAARAGAKVGEVPVIFTKRTHGCSKNRLLRAMALAFVATNRIKLLGW